MKCQSRKQYCMFCDLVIKILLYRIHMMSLKTLLFWVRKFKHSAYVLIHYVCPRVCSSFGELETQFILMEPLYHYLYLENKNSSSTFISFFFLIIFIVHNAYYQLHAVSVILDLATVDVCIILSREGTSLRMKMSYKKWDYSNKNIKMKCISFYLGQVFLWIHHLIRAEEIIYCIYVWLPVGVAVTLHVHTLLGRGGLMGWFWVRRLGSEMDNDLICLHIVSHIWHLLVPMGLECDAALNTHFLITFTIITIINSSNTNG